MRDFCCKGIWTCAPRVKPNGKALRGADGVLRVHWRKHCERALMTLFGEVTVQRMRYGMAGHDSVFPSDAELNLPADKHSHGLGKRVAEC